MTKGDAEALVKKHGNITKAASAAGMPRSSFRRLLSGGATQAPVARAAADVSPATGGFTLTGKHLLVERPKDVWKGRFYALRRGMGYLVDHLSSEWGTSTELIRSKAKSMGALRYVEETANPGIYVACVVHPETPKGK